MLRMACIAVCILSAMYVIVVSSQMMALSSSSNEDEGLSVLFSKSSSSSYYHHYPPESSEAKNELLKTFESVMSNATWHIMSNATWHIPGREYVPFIVNDDGRVLCRKSRLYNWRVNTFLEMTTLGMQLHSNSYDDTFFSYNIPNVKDVMYDNANRRRWAGLPVIALEGDSSGCYHRDRIRHDELGPFNGNGPVDRVLFPRLTWHTPSQKHGSGWCHAIGMPGYESWRMIRDMGISGRYSWNRRFFMNEWWYPWRNKINKAVWRGSTTGCLYRNFDDLPRAKLVKEGAMHSDLFDVGFTSFLQGWEKQEKEIWNQMTKKGPISFDDQMRYRAIIDIDGNTWSSRFPKLLCTNSVIIKVRYGVYQNESWYHTAYSLGLTIRATFHLLIVLLAPSGKI